jgi:hypothetical protein
LQEAAIPVATIITTNVATIITTNVATIITTNVATIITTNVATIITNNQVKRLRQAGMEGQAELVVLAEKADKAERT